MSRMVPFVQVMTETAAVWVMCIMQVYLQTLHLTAVAAIVQEPAQEAVLQMVVHKPIM